MNKQQQAQSAFQSSHCGFDKERWRIQTSWWRVQKYECVGPYYSIYSSKKNVCEPLGIAVVILVKGTVKHNFK